MKIKLPVTWEMSGIVEVEAESVEEAMDYFDKNMDYIDLPDEDNSSYVDASFRLTDDEVEFVELFQEG
jgi:hypothetical protein